jgi:hypothetical protein
VDDEQLYEAAVAELRRGVLRGGLWARAVAESRGNEYEAIAAYLQLRVRQLVEAEALSAGGGRPQPETRRNLDPDGERLIVFSTGFFAGIAVAVVVIITVYSALW